MAEERLQLIGSIPLPIGHEVELTWFHEEKVSIGLLGGETRKKVDIDTPLVVDRTTGIRYGAFAHYVGTGAYRAGQINVSNHTMRDDLVPRRVLRGKVRACSIVDIRFEGRESGQMETELVIDEDG